MHEQGLRRVRGGRARRPRARIVRRDHATLLGLLRPRALRRRARRRDGREPRLTFVRHGPIRPPSSRVLAVIGRAPVRGAGPRDRGGRPAAASQLAALAIGDRRALRRDVGGRRHRVGTRGTVRPRHALVAALGLIVAGIAVAGAGHRSPCGRWRWPWPGSASVSPTRDRSGCSSKACPRSGSSRPWSCGPRSASSATSSGRSPGGSWRRPPDTRRSVSSRLLATIPVLILANGCAVRRGPVNPRARELRRHADGTSGTGSRGTLGPGGGTKRRDTVPERQGGRGEEVIGRDDGQNDRSRRRRPVHRCVETRISRSLGGVPAGTGSPGRARPAWSAVRTPRTTRTPPARRPSPPSRPPRSRRSGSWRR